MSPKWCGTFADPAEMDEADSYAVLKFTEFLSFAGAPGSGPLPDECFIDPEWREFIGITNEEAEAVVFVRWACGIRVKRPVSLPVEGEEE